MHTTQNYNQPASFPGEHDFQWYAASYIDKISYDATAATLFVMFTLNCCDGPCANPKSGAGYVIVMWCDVM